MFWVISVYFNLRNTLPKFGTFLLGHPVYKVRQIFCFRVFSVAAFFMVLKCVFQGVNVELNECDSHLQKPTELGDEMDSVTCHSEIADCRSEQGRAVVKQQTY